VRGGCHDRSPHESQSGWHGQAAARGAGELGGPDPAALRGLLAYGGFAWFLWELCELQKTRPQVAGHPAMFAGCLLAVVLFHVGSLLTWGGPELFRGEAATQL
jgi:hypothetical protein